MGLGRSVSTLARVLGPSAAGVVFHLMGKDWPFYVGGLVLVGVVFIAAIGARATPLAAASAPPDVGDSLAEPTDLGTAGSDGKRGP